MATMKYKPNGKTYELNLYVDPHPGKDRWDRVRSDCVRCGGTGIYSQYHGVCYRCWGRKSDPDGISVNTLRRQAKEKALWAEYGDELRAYHEGIAAANAEREKAEELVRAWAEAHAEKERREAMVSGFVGEIGEKVSNLHGVVKVAQTYDASYGYRKATGMFMVVELDDGKVVKIAGTGASLFGPERGDEVLILSATVKGHENYKGQDQTKLYRVKLDDFNRRAAQCLAYGRTDAAEAIEYGYINKKERERFEAYVEAARAEYEKELLDA